LFKTARSVAIAARKPVSAVKNVVVQKIAYFSSLIDIFPYYRALSKETVGS